MTVPTPARPSGSSAAPGLPEVLTVGRVGVDLYPSVDDHPEHIGAPLTAVATFDRFLGGTATNVAVAAARLGHRSAVLTKVGPDPFGDYVRTALAGFGVDPRFVGTETGLLTPVVFCALAPPEDPPLLFYRLPVAPDLTLTADDVPWDTVADVPLLWVTGTGASVEPGTLHPAGDAPAPRAGALLDRPVDGARPRLAADVLAVPARGDPRVRPDARARRRRRRQPGRGRGRRRDPRPGGGGPAAPGPRPAARPGQEGRGRRARRLARRHGDRPTAAGGRRQRSRRRRRLRRCALPRAPRGLGPHPHGAPRQRRGRARRLTARLLRRHAHARRARAAHAHRYRAERPAGCRRPGRGPHDLRSFGPAAR